MDGWAVASRAATAWLSAVRLPGSESWEMPSGVRFLKSSRIRTQAFFGAMRGRTGTATPPRRGITRRRRSSVQKMGPEVSGGGGGGAGEGAGGGGGGGGGCGGGGPLRGLLLGLHLRLGFRSGGLRSRGSGGGGGRHCGGGGATGLRGALLLFLGRELVVLGLGLHVGGEGLLLGLSVRADASPAHGEAGALEIDLPEFLR